MEGGDLSVIPGQCGDCHAMTTGNGEDVELCIFWVDAEEGGQPLSYEVQIRNADEPSEGPWAEVLREQIQFSGPGSAEITGLSGPLLQGRAQFRIRGVNDMGPGQWSEPSN